uniref:Threonine synthase n=1 Tax=Candidatus Kentrum sp. LFY TaxID=2126342 RepID=A0A450V1G4_9GAMM|nr:MAG: threonine synthase [Candidatus Kentron sp. LFY]
MMDTYLQSLRCSHTGATLPVGKLHNLSPASRPITCHYDLSAIVRHVDRDAISARRGGVWRWRELLPLPLSESPVTLGEGDTPLLPSPRLGEALGLDRLWVKDESINPTGSFKARGLTLAVTMARHLGVKDLIIPSAGNAAGAMAAYAARAGLGCHVFIPKDTPEINRLEVVMMGGNIELVDGVISDCGRVVAEQKAALEAFDLSTLKEPYRIEGKKTMGLELAEQLGWRLPDVIFYPTGGGTGLIGMHKAFGELARLGWISEDERPRLVSVQATGCAPIVRAFAQKQEYADPWEDPCTVAAGLRVPGAIGDFLMLRALRETSGTAVAVDDEELLHGMTVMARTEGINACPEGGACVAAARRLLASGWLDPKEEIVFFNTGAGTKYVEALRRCAH